MPSDHPIYDQEAEQRRIRERDPRPTHLQFIDDGFWALFEMTVCSVPALAVLVLSQSIPFQSGGVIAFLATWLAITVFRGEWVPVGQPWPAVSAWSGAGRVVHYNAALFVGPYLGFLTRLQGYHTAVLIVIAAVVSFLAVGTLPWTTALGSALARRVRGPAA